MDRRIKSSPWSTSFAHGYGFGSTVIDLTSGSWNLTFQPSLEKGGALWKLAVICVALGRLIGIIIAYCSPMEKPWTHARHPQCLSGKATGIDIQ